MSSRALSLATVLLLIAFGAAQTALAQPTNLEAGKTPSQLFAQTCNVCHKSPRGLLKSVAPGSLPGFLRQHYTTSSDMAGVLATYLISNGATDTRYQAKDGKKDASSNPEHQGRRPRVQDAARSEGEAAAPSAESPRQRRALRPAEDGAKPEGQSAPEGRKSKRRAQPGTEDAPKVDATAPASGDKKSDSKTEPDSGRAPVEPKPDSGPRSSSDTPAPRPDPVPQVTPAAPAAAKPAEPKPAEPKSAEPKPVEEAAPKPAASSEPAPAPKPQEQAPPATAAAPPPAPAAPSGSPAPPISR